MSLQLYQVDQKNYLLDFKSLDTVDHPDAARVKRMTRASMSASGDDNAGKMFLQILMPAVALLPQHDVGQPVNILGTIRGVAY